MILEFRHKSFAFERQLAPRSGELAVFGRTETESESKFRPQLLHLSVLVPTSWLELDPATQELLLRSEGRASPTSSPGSATAQEIAAEPDEFAEAGIDWVRWHPRSDRRVYVPKEIADALHADAAVSTWLGGAR